MSSGLYFRDWILVLALLLGQNFAIAADAAGVDAVVSDVQESPVMTPAPGTSLRKEILDALRAEVFKWHGLEVVFVVTELKVKGDWAWVATLPESRDGQSHYEDILALMNKRDGAWTVAELVCTEEDNPECLGAPDYFAKLMERFPGVPEEILPALEETEQETW